MKTLNMLFVVSLGAGVAVIGAACGGSTVDIIPGTDGGTTQGSQDGSSASPPGSDGSTTTTNNDAGMIIVVDDAGVPTVDGGMVVQGNPFPCGQAVCNPPQVCCETAGMGGRGGATTTCEDKSACSAGVAEGCSAETCPTGTVCCGSLNTGTGGISGYTACETACPTGTAQLCDPAKGSTAPACPTGDQCEGFGAAGGVDICRAAMARPDAGVLPPFDGGAGPPPPMTDGG